jgi:hypothetical protein
LTIGAGAVRSDQNLLERSARFGYGARGLVYCLVGGLALLAAIGSGGQTGGSRSALGTLVQQPFGKVLLAAVALGLFAFAGWRFIEALTDADGRGTSGKGLAIRAAHVLSGIVYAGLAISTVGLVLGTGGGGGEDQTARDWTAWLMAKPLGPWLVGAVGLGVIGAGLAFLKKGWNGDVARFLSLEGNADRWAVPLGRAGYAARGVVFVLIGGFVVLAAVRGSSSQVRGLGGALKALQEQPLGWLMLAITAVGLFAFGLFGLVQARYRRIHAPDMGDAVASAPDAIRSIAR